MNPSAIHSLCTEREGGSERASATKRREQEAEIEIDLTASEIMELEGEREREREKFRIEITRSNAKQNARMAAGFDKVLNCGRKYRKIKLFAFH